MTNEETPNVENFLVFFDDPTKTADHTEAALDGFCKTNDLDYKVVRKLERVGYILISTTRSTAEQISKAKGLNLVVAEGNGKKFIRV